MPDRLDPEIVRLAEESARKPDYAAVLARGAALSRRRTATALIATVVVVACLVGLTQLGSRPQAVEPVVPSPSPTASESPESPEPTAVESPEVFRPTAQQIVEDPDSQLVDVKSAPGDPDSRIALWRWCPDDSCGVLRQAVAFTRNGFKTSTVPDVTWSNALIRMTANGDAVVLNHARKLQIEVVRQDGSVAEIDMVEDVTPVTEGELVAGVDHRARSTVFWAVDTARLVAHAVPVPADTHELIQTPSGQLRAMIRPDGYAWSDDGGTTWNERGELGDGTMLHGFVASLSDTHVVVRGGDGATLFPFGELWRLEDDGAWGVTKGPDDPTAYIGKSAVLADGRLVVAIDDWSDFNYKRPLEGTPPGIYVSAGDDWSTYERIESGAPYETPTPMQPRVIDIEITEEGAVLTALGPDAKTVWTSNDLGATWREMRFR